MLLTATLALQCPGHLRLYIRLDYAGSEGMVAGARRVRRSTECEQATPVTARRQRQAAQGERPSTGSRQLRRASRHFSTSWMPPRARRQGRVQVWASTTTPLLYTWREMFVCLLCVAAVNRKIPLRIHAFRMKQTDFSCQISGFSVSLNSARCRIHGKHEFILNFMNS